MSESPPSSLKIEQKYDEFVRFHPDGEIELKSLGTARLAGVRIRDVNETSQPESWDAVAKLVTSVSRSVFVERDPASGKIVVFYRQPIRLPDHYFPWYLNAPQTSWVCLNEGLVYLGLAKVCSDSAAMKEGVQSDLRLARGAYARLAFVGPIYPVRLNNVVADPRLLVQYKSGWPEAKMDYAMNPILANGDLRAKGSNAWWNAYHSCDGRLPDPAILPPEPKVSQVPEQP